METKIFSLQGSETHVRKHSYQSLGLFNTLQLLLLTSVSVQTALSTDGDGSVALAYLTAECVKGLAPVFPFLFY
jgi:hypothetical protein